MVIKQLNDIEKQTEDDNKSNFTIELDLEKQVDSLIYDEDAAQYDMLTLNRQGDNFILSHVAATLRKRIPT